MFRPLHFARLNALNLIVILGILTLPPPVFAAEESSDTDASESKAEGSEKKDEKKKIKDYDDVITEDAVSQSGLFRVHELDDKLFYEITPDKLGTDFLWVTQISETTAGNSYAGMPAGNLVVRWEQRDEKILLREVRYGIRASTDDPIAQAVRKSNLAPVIRVFDVKAFGRDKAPVIDVTELFTKEVPEISAKPALNAGNIDSGRSFIEKVKAFPANINVVVMATYNHEKKDDHPRSSGISAVIHHSMVELPDDPMEPRRHDERVGFFSVGFTEYGINPDHAAEEIKYVTRWRIEKKDPDAAMSEPVKPIVFYVGREVPEKWKSYVKQGIEDWQPAFESAGFTNAILGKLPPDERENPDWDPEDARISSIRWLPSSTENAFGPHVHDPRTGEILEADVRMYHNVQKLVRDWYFIQASASDKRAQKLPMPDVLMGELIRFVVAHEVGHSIGFPHNMQASSAYTIEQLRDPEWTRKNGTAPSIMDYARFNYVAQPEDGAALLPQVGPYDHFAVQWGYSQFSDEEEEKSGLAALVKKQIDNPVYRFGGGNPNLDSTRQTEDLGADAVGATRLGLKNLERIAGNLVTATSEPGENYDLLDNMYDSLWSQWSREMGHVVNVVAGVRQVNLFYGDADQRFFPNDAEDQREAVAFLTEHALTAPKVLLKEDILGRLTAEGVASRVLNAQERIFKGIINESRMSRLAEYAEASDDNPYTPSECLSDLRKAVFAELHAEPVEVGIYRRNLQRAYVDHLAGFLENPSAGSDLPALARFELEELAELSDPLLERDLPGLIQAHLMDLNARARKALSIED